MQDLIPKELATYEYYYSRIPYYLQKSNSFKEHFKIWIDFLKGDAFNNGVIKTSEQLLSFIDVFNDADETYVTRMNKILNDYPGNFNILDKLGSIFNIRRSFVISYLDGLTKVTEEIKLSNEEFLFLIRAQIIKNYSDGSYQQMREFYDKSNLPIYFKSSASGSVDVHLLSFSRTTPNIIKMFKAGLLTIQSMGIRYIYNVTDYLSVMIWDTANSKWDSNNWGI